MSDEDDRYGPPTHSCKYCNNCFPATWEYVNGKAKGLNIDLLLDGTGAVAAALDGCQFFLVALYPHKPGAETTRVRFLLERKTRYRDHIIGPYLEGSKVLESLDPAMQAPRDPSFWKESEVELDGRQHHLVFHSFRSGAEPKGRSWFDDLLLPPNLNPLSIRSIKRMQIWLKKSSAKAQPSSRINTVSASVMPKRLLKIQPGGDTIYVTRTTQAQTYALLSYCWGGDQEIKTTSSNLDSHERGIEIASLSRTICDAVLVAEYLNLEYLWVDALCIVQDDQDELAQEIANQAKLYQNGVVTILAGGAASASDGFLHRGSRRYPRFALQVRLPDGHGRQIMIDTSLPHYILGSQWQHSPDPIDNRGWIFQEVLLSPNIIYFNPFQTQMLSGREVETDGGLPSYAFPYRRFVHDIDDMRSTSSSSVSQESFEGLSDAWGELIYDYTKRKLTHSADKLLAVSAVAEAFFVTFMGHELASESYLAGLWRQHMPFNLLWIRNVYDDVHHRPAYRAPSWSWASIDSPALFNDYRSMGSKHRNRYTATVVHAQTQLTSRVAPYGQVTGGELQVDGLLKQIPNYSIEGINIKLFDEEYSFEEASLLDAYQPELTTKPGHELRLLVYLLCIIRSSDAEDGAQFSHQEWSGPLHDSYGLILGRKPNADKYIRIGRYEFHTQSREQDTKLMRWQQSFERKTITLV